MTNRVLQANPKTASDDLPAQRIFLEVMYFAPLSIKSTPLFLCSSFPHTRNNVGYYVQPVSWAAILRTQVMFVLHLMNTLCSTLYVFLHLSKAHIREVEAMCFQCVIILKNKKKNNDFGERHSENNFKKDIDSFLFRKRETVKDTFFYAR